MRWNSRWTGQSAGETAMCGASVHHGIMEMRIRSGVADGEVQISAYVPGMDPVGRIRSLLSDRCGDGLHPSL